MIILLVFLRQINSKFQTSIFDHFLLSFLSGSLRSRLASLEADHRLGKISYDSYFSQAGELLLLLEKLGEELSIGEKELLQKVRRRINSLCFICRGMIYDSFYLFQKRKNMEGYEAASDEIGTFFDE